MKKILTNEEIYNIGNSLLEYFNEDNKYFPAKVGFFIEKNKQNILTLAKEIELARLKVVKEYGYFDEEKQQYLVNPENVEKANEELLNLLEIEQEVEIYIININELEGVQFNTKEIQTLMFMIEEE